MDSYDIRFWDIKKLPKTGWGRIVLLASASRAGRAWTDEGTARQERGLKHRAANETRTMSDLIELDIVLAGE